MPEYNAKIVAAERDEESAGFFEALAAAVCPLLEALFAEDERERDAAWMLMGVQA